MIIPINKAVTCEAGEVLAAPLTLKSHSSFFSFLPFFPAELRRDPLLGVLLRDLCFPAEDDFFAGADFDGVEALFA